MMLQRMPPAGANDRVIARSRAAVSPSIVRAVVGVAGLACCLPTARAAASPPAPASAVPSCRAGDVALRVETPSRRTAIAVLRNVADRACDLAAFPPVMLLSRRGAILARAAPTARRDGASSRRVSPLALDAGATAASALGWTTTADGADAAGTATQSVMAERLAVTLSDGPVSAPLRSPLAVRPGTFTMHAFTTALAPLGNASRLRPGTYVGTGPADSTLLVDGVAARTLTIRRDARGTRLSFSGLGGMAPNAGALAGPLTVAGSTATLSDAQADCMLTLHAFGAQLVVEQRGDCGFGNAVTAAGRYRSLHATP